MGVFNVELKDKLSFLSNLSETDFPFISLYLTVNGTEFLKQKEENRIFLKNTFDENHELIKSLKQRDKLECFKKDMEKIKFFLENNLRTNTHGLAIFACSETGVFETFESLMPFENYFHVNSFPHLRQLAYYADEYENALVIMTDSRYSKIFTVKLGGFILDKVEIKDKIHRFHKEGGWAQMRYQRHIEDKVEHHYKEVANKATEIVDNENFTNVVLIGQEFEIKTYLQNELPKRITSKIVDMNPLQMRENNNNIIRAILKSLRMKEREKELLIVKDIITKTEKGGNETLGLQDTIKLAKEGRINLLTVSKNTVSSGWKCNGCLYVDKNQYQAMCPKCNGNTKSTDLIEEVIRFTLQNKGSVEIVDEEAAVELDKHEGIGAYLRY